MQIGKMALCACMLMAPVAFAEPLRLAVTHAEFETTGQATGGPQLLVDLAPEGQRALAEFTRRNLGRIVDIRIDGRLMASPRIATPITGSQLAIRGYPDDLCRLMGPLSEGKVVIEVSLREE